jgi:prepilin signal peptidase PulO-like enzyme (type II secretory pathway)
MLRKKYNVPFNLIECLNYATNFAMIKIRYVTLSNFVTIALILFVSRLEANATVDVEIILFKFSFAIAITIGCTSKKKDIGFRT